MQITRRGFGLGISSLALAGLTGRLLAAETGAMLSEVKGYGPLIEDPQGLIDLPEGFSYRVISRFGQLMDDGHQVPSAADGMGCFDLGNGKLALVRNHELRARDGRFGPLLDDPGADFATYDRDDEGKPLPGGTSTIVYDPKTGRTESQYLSLSGTIRNCAGGITPWGSWLTCEEDTTRSGNKVGQDHGYVFEVPAAHKGLVTPVPLKALGRFNHEAACIDPTTGIVYLTEDREDGLFYRLLPAAKGDLKQGGRLQALAFVRQTAADSRNKDGARAIAVSEWVDARWVDLDNVEAPEDDLRMRGTQAGAAVFARGEGIWWSESAKELFFACTSGGPAGCGQIYRYRPSAKEGHKDERRQPGKLELFFESTSTALYNYGDNLTVMPNGHLMVCEDQYTPIVDNHLRGITAQGKAYAFARSRLQTELTGVCTSPDGSTMFVNFFNPTTTLAITGPWGNVSTLVTG